MGKKLIKKFSTAALLCLGMAASAWADPAQVTITASANPVQVGDMVGVDVFISGVTDLYGFQFDLSFDSGLLQSTAVSEGSFLATGGATYGYDGSVDNTAGTISYMTYVLQTDVSGVNGGGVLMHLSFDAVSAGTAALSLANASFLDSAGHDISVNIQPGSVVISAVPEPDMVCLFGAGFGLLVWRRRQQAATARN